MEKQHNLEGYYLLEDAEGYLFQEADGGYYFFPCLKGRDSTTIVKKASTFMLERAYTRRSMGWRPLILSYRDSPLVLTTLARWGRASVTMATSTSWASITTATLTSWASITTSTSTS